MRLQECTLVLGVDAAHLEELRWTWPTWVRWKPELREMPAVVFYDPAQVDPHHAEFLAEHPNWRWIPWRMPGAADQREMMLTGWVHVPARHVETLWYLKLDTDVVATGPGEWLRDEWFQPDAHGREPAMISSRWSYTKPRDAIARLDEWGDSIPALRAHPRLNLQPSPGENRVYHRRIISWIFFGRTEWTREVAGWLGPEGRLPTPSQDAFLFYCAKRSGQRIVTDRMTRYHWAHKRLRTIRQLVATLQMEPAGKGGNGASR